MISIHNIEWLKNHDEIIDTVLTFTVKEYLLLKIEKKINFHLCVFFFYYELYIFLQLKAEVNSFSLGIIRTELSMLYFIGKKTYSFTTSFAGCAPHLG